MFLKIDFKCPKCKNKKRIKVYNELSEKDIDLIIKDEFLNFLCPNCNETIRLNYDLKYLSEKVHVYYVTDKTEIKDDFNPSRITYTYDDFKEKILIFNEDLNDLVIMFIKCFIHDQVSDKESLKEIRFNNVTDSELVFFLVGLNTYAKVPYGFYESLLKKSKIKKIKGAVLIDEGNFRDYFKMR